MCAFLLPYFLPLSWTMDWGRLLALTAAPANCGQWPALHMWPNLSQENMFLFLQMWTLEAQEQWLNPAQGHRATTCHYNLTPLPWKGCGYSVQRNLSAFSSRWRLGSHGPLTILPETLSSQGTECGGPLLTSILNSWQQHRCHLYGPTEIKPLMETSLAPASL